MPESNFRKTCKGKGGPERREGEKVGKSVIVFLQCAPEANGKKHFKKSDFPISEAPERSSKEESDKVLDLVTEVIGDLYLGWFCGEMGP